jgi:hypothetical protein
MDYPGLTGITCLEIQLNDNGGEYPLPQNQILQENRIIGLCILANPSTDHKSKTGRPIVSDTELAAGFLTLQKNSNKFCDQVPLDFFTTKSSDDRFVKIGINDGFDPTMSTIQFKGLTTGFTGDSVQIIFLYDNSKVC